MSFTFADLRRWFENAGIEGCFNAFAQGEGSELPMSSLGFDSRSLGGGVFCGVAGEITHGARFAGEAMERGAQGLWIEAESLEGLAQIADDVPMVATSDARAALAAAASQWIAEHPIAVVAITGSNGKTTTKDYTQAALASLRVAASPGNLNSSWGLPAAVLSLPESIDVAVLEMGASGVGEIDALCRIAPPTISVITNVGAAHLEAFDSREEVARTKAAVVRRLPEDGIAVLPRDDEFYEFFLDEARGRATLSFGASASADVRVIGARSTADGVDANVDGIDVSLPIFGVVNAWNAAAAVAVARALDVDAPSAVEGIAGARWSAHRSRILSRGAGFVIDDSYNANPPSMCAALDALIQRPAPGRRIAVLGTMAELGNASAASHHEVIARALELGVDRLWVVGDEMAAAAATIEDSRIEVAPSVDALVTLLLDDARTDDTWLIKGSRSVGLERVAEGLLSNTPAAHRMEGEEAT